MDRQHFHTERARIATQLAEWREKLDIAQGNLSPSNSVRDADIETCEFQIRCLEQEMEEIYNLTD
jgi:hypothetical protein